MTISEALGLRYADIDFHNAVSAFTKNMAENRSERAE